MVPSADHEPPPDPRGERALCVRCLRPRSHCYCARLPSLASRTELLFIQHPREHRVAIGTARMAHLALPSSRLVVGVDVEDEPHVRDVLGRFDVAVLFPSPDATPLDEAARAPPAVLVVLDGTWSQARKLLTRNPRLAALPRIAFHPERPGNYRIRREPSAQHLATIEAVAAVLGALEGDPARFQALLTPFTHMVDEQLEAARVGSGRRRRRRRRPPGVPPELRPVVDAPERVVVLYAEANAHPRHDRAPGSPELIHLVGARPSSGARFASVLAPRRALPEEVARRIGLDPRDLAAGERVDAMMPRLTRFLDDDPLLVLWGPYTRDLLAAEGVRRHGFVDLRALVARVLGHTAGGVLGAADALGVVVDKRGPRAAWTLELLVDVLRAVVARASDVGASEGGVSPRVGT